MKATADSNRLLEVKGLQKFFPIRKGFLQKVVGHVRAVDDVSFFIREGETFSLVGESGCGKTTTSRCILRAVHPTSGQILFRTAAGKVVDVATLPEDQLKPLRSEMQMIFQDPFSSLNPRMTLLDIVGEPLLVNGVTDREERTARVAELLKVVGMRPEYMRRFPHAFSGGSASASASRARSRCDRGWSLQMSRYRRWTSPSRPRSSTCSWNCRPNSG